MSKYMLMFSLGPVQSFIAQARKTRDLWQGSFLLATLMEASMQGIEQQNLIYPSNPSIEGNIADLPNKYVAIFDTLDEAKAVAPQSEEFVKKAWKDICDTVWRQVLMKVATQSLVIAGQIWDRQVNPDVFFEIFWVIVEGEVHEYPQWIDKTQKALDARKRLRHVRLQDEQKVGQKVLEDEPGEKSTISGEREALRSKDPSREGVRKFWQEIAAAKSIADTRSMHHINPDGEERLDAIDTVKRFAYLYYQDIDAGFPSTSSITTASFIEAVLQHAVKTEPILDWLAATEDPLNKAQSSAIPLLAKYKVEDSIKGILVRDGDCYFPETFTPYRLTKDYAITPVAEAEQRAQRGRQALKDLLHTTDEAGITRPIPYYAMIQMDGDRMGTLISNVEDDQEHKAISQALSNFSRETVPSIVQQKYPGRLIYAGGDDVFALAPLARDIEPEKGDRTCINLADHLRQAYHEDVKLAVNTEERKRSVTASTGIAIAHHYTSLSYVRRVAKEAEEAAKQNYGRNALVVTVIRRSGEQTSVGCHWEYQTETGQSLKPIEVFTVFYNLFKHDLLSPKCVHTLLSEAPALVKLEREAQQSEVRRVLRRQRSGGEKEYFPDEKINELAVSLIATAEAMDGKKKDGLSTELHSTEKRYGLVETLGWLLVMAFLARKEQD